ncbi:5'-nucleotidase C-terminal domain-containing protein, partial [bacterium]|nr:5'-nucleotidase C-terminal domain-containing protein [bacterium]
KSKSNEPVVIVQAGENGQYHGILNVEFDESGKLTKIENALHKSEQLEKSPTVEYIKSQNLGQSEHIGTISTSDTLTQNRRIEPNGWTELLADSIKSELGVDIALVNSANTRKIPKAGQLTALDIQESTPMKNSLLITKISQKQLVEAIKNAAKNTMTAPDGYPGLLQGSGFSYKIDDTGELLEFNILHDGKKIPIDINNPSEDVLYTASYDNFVAKSDGETPELAPLFEVKELDFDKDKTLTDYISKLPNKEKLEVKCDGRLEIIKTSKEKQKDNNTRKI